MKEIMSSDERNVVRTPMVDLKSKEWIPFQFKVSQ